MEGDPNWRTDAMPPSRAVAPPPVADLEVDPAGLFRQLESRLRPARPDEDLLALRKAFDFALRCHRDQRRNSGEPYIVHPVQTAVILADMNLDLVCLQTGLLHDVVEDTPATLEEVRREFGDEVARCVDGVTKLGKLEFYSPEERQAESVRKMLLAMTSDLRVILVKLADRLHNMRTLAFCPAETQKRVAQETLEIYAPIAHRLGMSVMRGELEDLAFSYLDPEAYAEIREAIESRRQAKQEFLEQIQREILELLKQEQVPARVEGRIKGVYSTYQKLRRQRVTIEQVYDLLAVRVITDTVKNCYAALGVIHGRWPHIPGRFKDFINMPRPNLYSSLHTSLMGPGGQPFEVQIRTEQMHRIAEEGIAAHWKYKEGSLRGGQQEEQRIAWLRHLLDWVQEMRDSRDFLSTLKVDLYPEEVYTFTPRGKVIVLPRDATPIDFAYAIHTEVGHTCVGAKVNGRIVPLRYALRNGDVVEILTQPGHLPSKDWLALVKTSRARQKIKAVINAAERARAIEIGQKYLEREARRLGIQLAKATRNELERMAGEYGYAKLEDLYAALGYGRFSPRKILQKLAPEGAGEEVAEPPAAAPPARPAAPGDVLVRVRGVDDLMVYRARCCNPIPGDPIVGYVTRGKGIAVHSTSCPNVQNLLYEVERRIEVEWGAPGDQCFPVKLVAHIEDRPGMLNHLTTILFNENINIRTLEARGETAHGDSAVVDMTIEVRDNKQLERLLAAMRRVSGVRDVQRL
jgi:guanosine-3',5'-bis(diphosphate) 3'-pyrophosphohydrolase